MLAHLSDPRGQNGQKNFKITTFGDLRPGKNPIWIRFQDSANLGGRDNSKKIFLQSDLFWWSTGRFCTFFEKWTFENSSQKFPKVQKSKKSIFTKLTQNGQNFTKKSKIAKFWPEKSIFGRFRPIWTPKKKCRKTRFWKIFENRFLWPPQLETYKSIFYDFGLIL